MDYSIKMVNVSKSFHKTKVVKSLNLTIPKGSLCAFLGSNGAGKSTTLNMIITLLQNDTGKIYIEGLDIKENKDMIRKKLGVVFQEDILDPKLTVYENLLYRGGLYLTNRKELKDRINTIIELLSIQPLLSKRYHACSGGQKRIVQIGRALLPNPSLLILDEPTVGLDPFAREQVWSLLRVLNQEQKITIFYSTHYMEEACYAEQVCMIHEGNLLLCQKINELCQRTSPEYVSRQLQMLYLKILREYESQKT